MATQSNIDVKILAEFVGKNAFKQADTATKQLTNSVKKLSGAIGLSFGVYGLKAMGQAFLEDAKAAQVLAQNLKNVGLGFNTVAAEAFIKAMQDQTGIMDDELRPAYAQLARVTGSALKTQQMLALAFDVAAGTGNSFASVVDALSQAYVGNTKGLKSLNTGLTTAELNTMTYAEIADRLAKQFKGSGQASLEGYAGQFALLNVKIEEAKEALGKSFIDVLAAFSGDQGVGGAGKTIEKLTGTFAKAIEGIAMLVDEVKIAGPILVAAGAAVFAAWSPWLAGIAAAVLAVGALGQLLGKNGPNTPGNMLGKYNLQTPQNKGPLWFPSSDASISKKIAADQKKAETAANKRAAELAALTKKSTKATQENLKLTKAKAIFDLQKIQIEAALKGKISEEDRIRLKLMQAIEDENISQIEKYTKLLTEAQAKTKELTDLLDKIKTKDAGDPFAGWKSSAGNTIEAINAMVAAMFKVQTQIQANGREWSSFANQVANTNIQSNGREWSSQFSPSATNPAANNTPPKVEVTVVAPPLTDPNAVAEAINQYIIDAVDRGTLRGGAY